MVFEEKQAEDEVVAGGVALERHGLIVELDAIHPLDRGGDLPRERHRAEYRHETGVEGKADVVLHRVALVKIVALAVGDVQQNEVRAGERRDRLFSLEIEQLRAVPAEILVEVALVGNVLREAAGEIRVVREAEIVADEVAHEAEPHRILRPDHPVLRDGRFGQELDEFRNHVVAGPGKMRADIQRRNIVRGNVAVDECDAAEFDAAGLEGGVEKVRHCKMCG